MRPEIGEDESKSPSQKNTLRLQGEKTYKSGTPGLNVYWYRPALTNGDQAAYDAARIHFALHQTQFLDSYLNKENIAAQSITTRIWRRNDVYVSKNCFRELPQ